MNGVNFVDLLLNTDTFVAFVALISTVLGALIARPGAFSKRKRKQLQIKLDEIYSPLFLEIIRLKNSDFSWPDQDRFIHLANRILSDHSSLIPIDLLNAVSGLNCDLSFKDQSEFEVIDRIVSNQYSELQKYLKFNKLYLNKSSRIKSFALRSVVGAIGSALVFLLAALIFNKRPIEEVFIVVLKGLWAYFLIFFVTLTLTDLLESR